MSVAEQLAAALLAAQERLRGALGRERARLAEERAELLRLIELSRDAGALEQRRSELEREIVEASRARAELTGRGEEWAAASERARRDLGERARERCEELLAASGRAGAAREFHDAMDSFAAELAEAGLSADGATPAQLLKQLPRLREAAARARSQAYAHAADLSASLAEAPALTGEQEKLEEARKGVQESLAETLARLRAHRTTEQTGLADDLAGADERALKRLRREVFEPLLADARFEREHGLAGQDPLRQLSLLSDQRGSG